MRTSWRFCLLMMRESQGRLDVIVGELTSLYRFSFRTTLIAGSTSAAKASKSDIEPTMLP